MTVGTLIYHHEKNNPKSHYFDKETLRYFGERISEMRVLKETARITDSAGEVHECYILSSLQRKDPRGATRHYHYFDTTTFKEVYGA